MKCHLANESSKKKKKVVKLFLLVGRDCRDINSYIVSIFHFMGTKSNFVGKRDLLLSKSHC